MNTNLAYPTPFEQKVLVLECSGKAPVKINLIVPSLVKPNIPFDLKVAVYDENGFPSVCCDAKLEIKCEQDSSLSFNLPFCEGKPAVARIENIILKDEGLHRFEVELEDKVFYSNPTYCSNSNKKQIFWGDPHIHTNLSNCNARRCRSMNFCFIAARYSTGLDWVSAADHVSNGRCEYAKWKEQIAIANQFNDPPDFVTLPAYEASLSSGCGGDNNIYMTYFPDIYVDENEGGNVKTLVEKLEEKMDKNDFITVPHHTSRVKKNGEIPDEIYPGKDMMPVIEIHSKWGTSEYCGNPNSLKDFHTGPCYANDLLKQGLALGFIGGTDSHSTLTTGMTSDNGLEVESERIAALPGMTAILTDKLDRKSIIKALKNHQCYAVSEERILITGDINGKSFGKKIIQKNSNAIKIKAVVAGKTDIKTIEIIRNGEVLHTLHPENWHATLEYSDHADLTDIALTSKHIDKFVYYYIRVTCQSGAQAWSSPAWVLM